MIKKHYDIEFEGQTDFFDKFHVSYDKDDSILADNEDCVYNGNILEFRLNIADLNKFLFQAIKHCSKMRVRGESVPAAIIDSLGILRRCPQRYLLDNFLNFFLKVQPLSK